MQLGECQLEMYVCKYVYENGCYWMAVWMLMQARCKYICTSEYVCSMNIEMRLRANCWYTNINEYMYMWMMIPEMMRLRCKWVRMQIYCFEIVKWFRHNFFLFLFCETLNSTEINAFCNAKYFNKRFANVCKNLQNKRKTNYKLVWVNWREKKWNVAPKINTNYDKLHGNIWNYYLLFLLPNFI